ncbi:MAG: RES family NAD+ phosphorylase [Vulcanimicrobiaceae bacterium]
MIAWRICKRAYANRRRVLSGEGAREIGGRWNRPGLALVYASETSSLALLETLVHAGVHALPRSLVAVAITIPDDVSITDVGERQLSTSWKASGDATCAELGSAWLEANTALVLRVPSAVNPLERNILFNPAHHDIRCCKVAAPAVIRYDPRLVQLFYPAE